MNQPRTDVRDTMPRSVMTAKQQQRIGALQAAKGILQSSDPDYLIRFARWIETGDDYR